MIKLQNIALRRGTQLLFENVDIDLHDGEKVGLIGDNGSGKTSLLAMLLGNIHPDQGDIRLPGGLRISHVAQETPNNERTALDHVLDGDTEYRIIESELNSAGNAHDQASVGLFTRMQDIDGYSAPARGAKLLSGLGFKPELHGQATRTFSGGWRVRLNLAQALMCPSDLLLLDEPTNHLDLDAIVWLEEWLKRYPGTVVLISHDREFVDASCKRILHIENQRIRSYSGNYSAFERQRAERLANEQSMRAKQQRKISHMEGFIERFRYKASKAKQAQSRIKALEKLKIIAPAHIGSPFNFEFKPCERVSDPILKLDHVDAGYNGKAVLHDVNLSVTRGDRIGLLGANGAGKSTLIKVLADEIPTMSGTRLATRHLRIGYFAQHQLEQLDPAISPMQQFQTRYAKATTQELRKFLGGFDFKGERVNEPIGPFSGGEKARLALALLIYAGPNVLLLDEPTNHLDMEMRHALSMAMQTFEGAIILVSHDRSLINNVTDRLLLIHSGRVKAFTGDMESYLRLLKQNNSGVEVDQNRTADIETRKGGNTKQNKKLRRQIMAQRREQLKPKRDLIRKLEKDIRSLQENIDSLNTVLSNPQTYETESTSNLSRMMQKKSGLEEQLENLENRWLTATDNLESLESSII
jgi:ATP-binding cassette subfamily F protein 3